MAQPLHRRTFLQAATVSLGAAAVTGCSVLSTEAKKSSTGAAAAAEGGKESPMLAELVKTGKLPPLEQRLPKNPMVVKPLASPGKYGGTLQRGQIDRNAEQNQYAAYAGLVEWTPTTPAQVGPGLAEKWEVLDGGKTYVFHLREGLKWSDGKPFTTDDLMFAYEKVFLDKELHPGGGPGWLKSGGKLGEFVKVDDKTLRIEFAAPHGLLLRNLCFIGATGGNNVDAILQPRHYLSQFLKSEAGDAGVKALMKRHGKQSVLDLYNDRRNVWKNADLPIMGAWKLVAPLKGSEVSAKLERNPYYWKVDEQGRQLPYIDRQQFTVMPADTLGLRAANGQIDLQLNDMQTDQLPLMIQNQQAKNYKVLRWTAEWNTAINLNQSHPDPVLRKLFQNIDFRAGLSHAINRKEMNDALLAGQGTPRHPCAQPEDEYWEDGMGQKFIEFSLEEANKKLDAAGLTERGPNGMRLRPDGKPMQLVGRCFEVGVAVPAITTLEYVRRYWKAVGIDLVIKNMSLTLWYDEIPHGDYDLCAYPTAMVLWDIDPLWYVPTANVTYWAPKYGEWYGNPKSKYALEPEAGSDIRKLQELYGQLLNAPDDAKRIEYGREILRLHDKNVWIIGTVASPFAPVIASGDLRNVRETALLSFRSAYDKATAPEQLYFENPEKHT